MTALDFQSIFVFEYSNPFDSKHYKSYKMPIENATLQRGGAVMKGIVQLFKDNKDVHSIVAGIKEGLTEQLIAGISGSLLTHWFYHFQQYLPWKSFLGIFLLAPLL